jgi:hypothetical protein
MLCERTLKLVAAASEGNMDAAVHAGIALAGASSTFGVAQLSLQSYGDALYYLDQPNDLAHRYHPSVPKSMPLLELLRPTFAYIHTEFVKA